MPRIAQVFKVLAAGNEPDFRTISDFRKIHIGTLQGLFEQVLEMALEVGAVKVDGLNVLIIYQLRQGSQSDAINRRH